MGGCEKVEEQRMMHEEKKSKEIKGTKNKGNEEDGVVGADIGWEATER